LKLTSEQIVKIEHVVNVWETGHPEGRYDDLSVGPDGPGNASQITYGRSGTTEYGNLAELVRRYCNAPGARPDLVATLAPLMPKIGRIPMSNHVGLKAALSAAGTDPVMRTTQDDFFRDVYFDPAAAWAQAHGFTLPLSALVIYDSFIHSGGIREDIRARFPEVPPSRGGDERAWIFAYTLERQTWLASHSRILLHGTIYRTRTMAREIFRGNWDLAHPITTQGVTIP
jgi:chitosanase